MTGVHLHLLANHVPILGTLFALILLAASFFVAPDVLRRTALVVLIVSAVAGAVAYFTGEPAEDAIRGFPGVQRALIHEHEEMAEVAWIVTGIVGLLALIVLVRWRRTAIPRGVAVGAFVVTAVASGLMGYTGLLGGRIRHTEIRPGATFALGRRLAASYRSRLALGCGHRTQLSAGRRLRLSALPSASAAGSATRLSATRLSASGSRAVGRSRQHSRSLEPAPSR